VPSSPTSIHPTSVVSPDAELGDGVTIAPYCVVHGGVTIGDDTFVDSHTVLGAPPADFYSAPRTYVPRACTIGANSIIRSHTVVYAGASLGATFECGHHVTVREGSRIGESVRVGTRCDLQGDLVIGSFARLHSNVFVAQRSTIEELTWLLPNVTLTNDPHPPSDSCTEGPTIRRGAVISAGATIFSAVEIGEGALVGAGSLVRHDVPPGALAYGVPARVAGRASDVTCREGRLEHVYPWWTHFRRGYPDGSLPDDVES
jgi:acetyltransferase-like isoleucine patch superfamily enzyme